MDMGLKDKVAVITGGSIGIGLAVAQALAREGVQLVLCARKRWRLAEVAAAIAQESGVQVVGIPADISQPDAIEQVVAAAGATFGGVDILINNAGTGSNETVMDAADAKWQYYWDLHVMLQVPVK